MESIVAHPNTGRPFDFRRRWTAGLIGVCPPKAKVTRSNRVGCATSVQNWCVCTENSNPDVMMVKPTEDRVGTNDSDLLNRTKTRRILVQRPMRSDGVVAE